MDKFVGMMLDNRYEILEVIGTGGMAVVYKARDQRLNRLVAIKILKEELALDADFRRRFHTESQAVAMMSHPNIVAVYDVSRTGDVEYIVMELIEGITLKQYMNRKGQLNWKESLHFSIQITKALSHAHSRGIIHRDIKPHNIMILKDGSIKVADFGIARLQGGQSSTLTQETLGSVHYISPEQAKGGHIDARSDLYSVGVVLYEMLTSKLPFEGDSPVSVAIQHISAIPLRPRELNPMIPKGLEAITMRAMNPDLEARYQSADEVLHDLEEFRKNPEQSFPAPAAEADVSSDFIPMTPPPAPTRRTEAPVVRQAPPKKRNNEMSREDYRKRKQKSRNVSTWLGVLCVFVLIIALVVFMWNFVLKDIITPQNDRVTVEGFVGKLRSQVEGSEYEDIYSFTWEEKESAEPAGTIIDQDPTEGRSRVPDERGLVSVTLTVSTGEEDPITMPNVYNLSEGNARTILNSLLLNLQIDVQEVSDDSVTEGYVVRTIPAEGSSLKKGDTVYLLISSGPKTKMVEVPDFYGYSLSKAREVIDLNNLTYGTTKEEYSETAAAGTVIGQSIAHGTSVSEKTEIILTISLGPAPTPEPSETPTPSPTPTPTPSPSPTPSPTPSPSPTPDPPLTEPID